MSGDKIDFDIELKNIGQIAIQFNTIISLVGQEENILFNAMNIKLTSNGEKEYELAPFRTGTSSLRTEWLSLGLNEESYIHVSFALPLTAENIYQGMETKFKCSLSAIQDLGDNNSLVNIFDKDGNPVLNSDATPIVVTTLKEAIDFTPDGGLIDVIRGSEGAENQNITIDKSISIQSSDSEMKNFANVHIAITSGGVLKMDNICLKGDSYIDISTATSLEINHCVFEITPSRLYDESTREYLDYAAGIVSRDVQQSGIRLVCTNSTFSTTNPSTMAFYLLSALTDGSIIENNVFGNTTFTYQNTPIYLSGAVVQSNDYAIIQLNNNKFYLNDQTNAVTLHKNVSNLYYLSSNNNTIIGGYQLAYMDESFSAVVFDKGSTIHGNPLTFDELGGSQSTLFSALNATLDEDGKFVSGTFKLSDGISKESFKDAFVHLLALDSNIVFEE